MHGLEAEYGSQIRFTYLDIDNPATQALQTQLGFRVQPHVFLLDGEGQVLKQWFGLVKRDEFISAFEQALP